MQYINRMGGVQYPKLNQITRKIWQFCEHRNNFLFATYIASADNFVADFESRRTDFESEWCLSENAFNTICLEYGMPEVDLFATYYNAKCSIFVS